MKRILSFALCLLLMIGCGTVTASAAQNKGITISFETAIYSISDETFVRTLPEPASQDECGPDEYVTVHLTIQNTSGKAVTLHNFCISIDGGKKLYWTDLTLEAGKTVTRHVYYVNAEYLTPGLHTAVVYASDKAIYSDRFSIGRAWSEIFKFPTEEQIKARPADERSPYLSAWFSIGSGVRYDAYCIDFKSDHIPCGAYSSLFNGYLDLSSLKEQYASADNNGHISLYGGLQSRGEGDGTNFILSFWDIYCTDADGNTTIIRPERTYPAEKTDNDSFGNEGEGAHTQLPYDWQAGRWYRMLLQCGTSETTGNTTVEQWFQDLTTGEWTHTVTYDTGVKDSAFLGNVAIFSENYLKQYAGGVRSLEVANARIHTTSDDQWLDVTSLSSIKSGNTSGVLANAYGSWEAGADDNSFYMISTGVSGWGRTEGTGKLTVKNRESGDPLEGNPLEGNTR